MLRADKILGLLRDKSLKCNLNQNEKQKNPKKCRTKNYETTADMISLFDEGKWVDFQDRIDESFKKIRKIKELKNDASPPVTEQLPPLSSTNTFESSTYEQRENQVEKTIAPEPQTNDASPPVTEQLPLSSTNTFESSTYEQRENQVEKMIAPEPQRNDASPPVTEQLPPLSSTNTFESSTYEQRENQVEKTIAPEPQTSERSSLNESLQSWSEYLELTVEELNGTPVDHLIDLLDSLNNDASPPVTEQLPLSSTNTFESTYEQRENQVEKTIAPEPQTMFEEQNFEFNTKQRKKNACPFCEPIILVTCSNYWRHLLRNHSDNVDVIRLNSFPKGSPERRAILADIRNKGNFLYNSSNDNYFVPSRRPLKEQSPKKNKYVTCAHCLVFVKRKNFFLHRKLCTKFDKNVTECKYCKIRLPEGRLSKHLKTMCTKRDTIIVDGDTSKKSKSQKRVLLNSSIFVNQNLVGASQDLIKNVLPILRIDDISETIKEDSLILKVGSKLRSNHKENHSIHDIISKMRPLGQILQIMRKMNVSIRTFKDCLKSQHVKLLFSAVQQMSGYDENTGVVKVPSMPGRIKGPLSLALQVLQNDIRCDPNLSYDTKQELLFDYKSTEHVIQTDWRFIISTNAQKSLNENHRNKGILMPLEEDIKTASEYLTKREELLLKEIQGSVDPVTYDNLCQAVIADIIIFNCRRAGEVARAGIKHYLERGDIAYEQDLKAVLSETELKAIDSLTMFYVPGKRDRTVPILLTDTMKRCVDMIVALRSEMGVSNSPLLFPRLYSDRPYDSCRIIRELKNKLTLKKPDHFNSTGFRHEIATSSHHQDAERPGYKRVLFSHMGHTEAVHNEKYVTPMPILQISKVGSTLLQRRSRTVINENKTLHTKQGKKTIPDTTCNFTEIEDSIDNSSSSEEEVDFVPKRKIKKIHNPWTVQQQECVIRCFKKFFINKSTPGKQQCQNLISAEECLKGRTWQQVKAFIENVNKKRRKLLPQLQNKYLSTI